VKTAGWIVLAGAVGLALVALAWGLQNWTARAQARKLKNPYPPTPEALAAASQLYTEHCRSCHGQDGDGKGERASELSVAPGDFTNRSQMDPESDGELYWQITKGRRPMPSFADKLNAQQRWELVDYVRTFASRAPAP
jgi:mono/diheme cytochrome c family protein